MIVAGAGIVGLSCAWRLAQRGVRCTVFDAREASAEASWTAAGMLAPGGEIDTPSAFATFALQSLALFPNFVRELERESGCAIDFRICGAIEVALTGVEAAALTAKAGRQAEIGVRSEAAHYHGHPARFYPDDAVVDPRDVNRALRVACERRGVTIREHEPVLEIASDGTAVRTAAGEYRDDAVLIAAGAWSSRLLPGLPRTFPVRGHLMSWELTHGLLDPIVRHGHTYLLQRRSGRIVAGTTTEHVGFDRTLDPVALDDIRSRAAVLMPVLGAMEPTARWNGFRPAIDAAEPVVGPIPGTRILTAFGHYRNGVMLAPETARRIAALTS